MKDEPERLVICEICWIKFPEDDRAMSELWDCCPDCARKLNGRDRYEGDGEDE